MLKQGTVQLRSNRTAHQRLCFRYIDSTHRTITEFLNPKFQTSSHHVWLNSSVCVGPGWKPWRHVFSWRGSIKVGIRWASLWENLSSGFQTRSDTNQAVQPHKMTRGLILQASSHLLWLYSPICVRPGQKRRRSVFSQRGSNRNRNDDQNIYIKKQFSYLCHLWVSWCEPGHGLAPERKDWHLH